MSPKYRSTNVARVRRVEIAGDGQHGIVRRVVGPKEARDILEARLTQILHRADERVVEGVIRRECQSWQPFPPRAVRLVVHRPAALILHDVALRVELLLRHRRKECAHAVGLQPEGDRQLVRRNRLEVVRTIEPGRAVERPARSLHQFEVLVRPERSPSPETACARTGAQIRCVHSRSFADPTWYHRLTATIGAE